MQAVTGFEDLDHGARGHVGPGLLLHPLVQVGVERLAQGVDGGDSEAAKPKFQRGWWRISIVSNDLRRFPVPVSVYTVINRSASACNASASVTWRNVVWWGSAVTTHVFRQRVPR